MIHHPLASWLEKGVHLSEEHPQLSMGTKEGGKRDEQRLYHPARLLSSRTSSQHRLRPSLSGAGSKRTSRAEGPGSVAPQTQGRHSQLRSWAVDRLLLTRVQARQGEPWGMDEDLAGAQDQGS